MRWRPVLLRVSGAGWPLGFRWMFLAALLLVLLKAGTAEEGLERAAGYLLASALHELLHWLVSWRLFPGFERRVVLAPLGGPAPVPNYPTARVVVGALLPAVLGALAGGFMLWRTWPAVQANGLAGRFSFYFAMISAANLLPFYPLDGHVWLAALIRRTHLYWRYPAWREYLGVAGGAAIGLAALRDILGAGELLLAAAVSITVDNLYMLRLRRRQSAGAGATGFPSPRRTSADERQRLDAILERVARHGMAAVSGEDREFLEEMSRRLRK